MTRIEKVEELTQLERITNLDSFVAKLHEMLKPFEDTRQDIRSGVCRALEQSGSRGGFVLVAAENGDIAGSLVMLDTGMSGYVPENLLLYVAVDEKQRGRGIGTMLINKAIEYCHGDIKLHVEYDNPAGRLYEKLGFVSKYADMRYTK
jgi:[ribosomal protein S18]-alanine N-acetyltransferase